ncbi:armadillo-type protein [Mycena metata]|uniref:Armadillo-type protein n=1 Tax=Mycena metata TaxID=1033252 RepID=A0AAD7H7Y8_9AGAR|nr:armadillo-type protein [Mycena metata]
MFPWPKTVVLRWLGRRTLRSKRDAQIVLDSNVFAGVSELLLCSNSSVVTASCEILEKLVDHEDLRTAIRGVGLHLQLVPLLRYRYHSVQRSAVYALHCFDMVEVLLSHLSNLDNISPDLQWYILDILNLRAQKDEQHARLIVDCGAFPACVSTLLRSPDPKILRSTCKVLWNIARYEVLIETVHELGLNTQLIELSTHSDEHVRMTVGNLLNRFEKRVTTGEHARDF